MFYTRADGHFGVVNVVFVTLTTNFIFYFFFSHTTFKHCGNVVSSVVDRRVNFAKCSKIIADNINPMMYQVFDAVHFGQLLARIDEKQWRFSAIISVRTKRPT